MRAYGRHPSHRPSAGPRQPQVVSSTDTTTHAERERALRIVAEAGRRLDRGEYAGLTPRELLVMIFRRIRDES